MIVRTLHDRILVRRVEHERTDGGLLLPVGDGRKNLRGEYTAEGVVVAVGSGPDVCEPREIAGLEIAATLAEAVAAEHYAPDEDGSLAHTVADRIRAEIATLRAASRPAPAVKPGDRIFFPSWVQQKAIRLNDEDLIEIKGSDVAAVLVS